MESADHLREPAREAAESVKPRNAIEPARSGGRIRWLGLPTFLGDIPRGTPRML